MKACRQLEQLGSSSVLPEPASGALFDWMRVIVAGGGGVATPEVDMLARCRACLHQVYHKRITSVSHAYATRITSV